MAKQERKRDDQLETLLRYWAADRESVSYLDIAEMKYTYDEGWAGSDVTPPEPWSMVISYVVTKRVSHRVEGGEMGNFLVELANVARRGPLP